MLRSVALSVNWDLISETIVQVFVIIALAWFVQLASLKLLKQLEKQLVRQKIAEGEPPSESVKRIQTLVRLLRQGVVLTIWITFSLALLNQVGVKIGPILAGAGILGLAVGFGAQNLVRDVISGFFLILENQVRVDDVAIINGTGGLVEQINFRTIVLRDLSGVVHIFPNGEIKSLSNMTHSWSAYVFELGVAYKENTDDVVSVIKEVCANLREDEKFGPLILEEEEIFGVDKFADSSVVIKGRIKTKPIRQWMVGREFLRRIKIAFDEKQIEIPFPHRTLYIGEKSKSLDISLLDQAVVTLKDESKS